MYKKRLMFSKNSSDSSSLKKAQKKGQVTIFIILGILLLLAVILIILLQKEVLVFNPDELVPSEKGAVEQFVSTCVEKIGEDALYRIGLQGGYIEVPEVWANQAYSLQITPFTFIPFWARGMETNIPTLPEIKQRIDKHIEENLRDCLFSEGAFQNTYNFVEKSSITSNTEIVESKVIFNVHWIVDIQTKEGETVSEIIDHLAESPIKLKKVHDTARKIIERELIEFKLEDLTQDLIALDHDDVPVAGFEMRCNEKKWKKTDVEQGLKNLLRINLPQIKVEGTNYVDFPEELSYYQSHYVWNIDDDYLQPQVSTLFSFQDNFPFSFNVHPSSGNTLSSNPIVGNNPLLSFLCMQSWKFVYDVFYPVQVDVIDETTGYRFKMAFTVHLKNNAPDRAQVQPDLPTYAHDTFTDEDFCNNAKVPMTIFTFEEVDNQEGVFYTDPLEGVDLSFDCLYYSCSKGKSEYDFGGMGHVAAYHSNFPFCAGGLFKGEKAGYKNGWTIAPTKIEGEVEIMLTPVISVPMSKVKVLKHSLSDGVVGDAEELGDDETALISLTFFKDVDENVSEEFHEVDVIYSTTKDPKILSQEKIDFLAKADYNYQLSITVLKEATLSGGYKADWQVSIDELELGDQLIFHVVTPLGESDDEQFTFFSDLEELSKQIPEPEIE
jgi:hypothetical protein